jgi:ribonuclease P protein component
LALPRRYRIARSAEFDRVFAGGHNAVGPTLVLWIRPREDAGPGRLGVVAAKRSFRRSVDRSRAKRLLREAYRLNRAALREGLDVVLVARRPILDVKVQSVEAELLRLAARAGARAPGMGRKGDSRAG